MFSRSPSDGEKLSAGRTCAAPRTRGNPRTPSESTAARQSSDSPRIGHAPTLDQAHRPKLELACKLPPLHDPPPVPSKHRNRQQAKAPFGALRSLRSLRSGCRRSAMIHGYWRTVRGRSWRECLEAVGWDNWERLAVILVPLIAAVVAAWFVLGDIESGLVRALASVGSTAFLALMLFIIQLLIPPRMAEEGEASHMAALKSVMTEQAT